MYRSRHNSPHQGGAFRRGLHVVTSADIRPYFTLQNHTVSVFWHDRISESRFADFLNDFHANLP